MVCHRTRVVAIAGECNREKTLSLVWLKNFLDANPDAGVLYFESESAITKQMIVDRGIDPKRMVIMPSVTTVQEFRTQAIRVLDDHLSKPEGDRPQMMFVSILWVCCLRPKK